MPRKLSLFTVLAVAVGLSVALVSPASADPPCSPGPNCYSLIRDYNANAATGGSSSIPRATTTIPYSSASNPSHINSEFWLLLGGSNDYMEAGLRNGYDAVNNATGACGCVAYNQFWAEHKNNVQTTHVIAHTAPSANSDLYEIVRGPSSGRWTVYMNHTDYGTSAALGSWTGANLDQGGEFQGPSCQPGWGTASTFNMNAAVRDGSYAWHAPSWDATVINAGCRFNGLWDGVQGHWSWNKP